MKVECKGSELHPDDMEYVLRAFVHRYTRDHIPRWVSEAESTGIRYGIQFASDADWLANTIFGIRKDGRLDYRCISCVSHPTWPNGIPDTFMPSI